MVKRLLQRGGSKVWRFCIKNRCLILPYPEKGTRATLLKNSALLFYVLVLLGFQFCIYRMSPQILGFATDIMLADLYKITNEKRVAAGAAPLKINHKLETAALAKAQDMFAKDYWAHYAPDGSTTPWQFILGAGYSYKYAGENLARNFDTSISVVEAWLASPSHKANLLNASYEDIGMAAVNGTLLGEETTLVVQMFGTVQVASTPKPSKPTPSTPGGGTAGTSKEEPEPEPATVIGPTEKQVAVSHPAALADAEASLLTGLVKAINPVSSPKTVPLGFGFMLVGLFVLDEAAMLRGGLTKEEMRRTGENVAHVAILGLLMMLVWLTRTGGIV